MESAKKQTANLYDNWQKLTSSKRKAKIEKCYHVLRQVGNKQLVLLRKYELDKSIQKTERHLYFFNLTKSFWKDGDFALALGKNKYSFYAVYPARTMFEKLFKMIWFSNLKTEDEQNKVAIMELLTSCLDLYRMEKDNGNSGKEYEEYYNIYNADGNFKDIKSITRSELKVFPNFEELCLKSGFDDSENLYKTYRYLCGLPHGQLLSIIMAKQDIAGEYRRYIMIIIRCCIEMLRTVDYNLEAKTQHDVQKAINKVAEIGEVNYSAPENLKK